MIFWTSEKNGGHVNLTWSHVWRTCRHLSLFLSLFIVTSTYNPRNIISDGQCRKSVEHGLPAASRHVAAVILLELGTCASHQTDTSGIVHLSYYATCLAISIPKSKIKVRSLQRTGRSCRRLTGAIHGFLREIWIHRLRSAIHGSRRSTDCAQQMHRWRKNEGKIFEKV